MATPPPSATAAAEAASDLGYLLRPLHWTAVLRHPHSAGKPPLLFRLGTITFASIVLSCISSEITVLLREGTADLDISILMISIADTGIIWVLRMVHTTVFERQFHKLALQVRQDFSEFVTWDDVPVLRAQGRAVRRFLLTYIWFGIIACTFFLFSPVSDEGLPYILALPFDASQPVGFGVAWVYCMVVTFHVVVMTMVLDSFNVSIMAQLRMQLTLLSSKMVSLAKGMNEKLEQSSDVTAYGDLHCRLEKCILHHQAIINNANLLEKCLGTMLLGQSLSIGAAACFQMFQIATSANGVQQIGKFGCYLGTMLAELFVNCWFGDDLITESENLALAAYDAVTSLHGCPVSIKRSLLLMMQRAQRPLSITAGGFFPLSRESFVAVLNVSYSFFAILRNFKNEDQ